MRWVYRRMLGISDEDTEFGELQYHVLAKAIKRAGKLKIERQYPSSEILRLRAKYANRHRSLNL